MTTDSLPYPFLIKPNLTYIDFQFHTLAYTQELKMTEQIKMELTQRIQAVTAPIFNALLIFVKDMYSPKPISHAAVEAGLQDTLAEIKLDLETHQQHNELHMGYWRIISWVFSQDALRLEDPRLEFLMRKFAKQIADLKAVPLKEIEMFLA
jgi:hypothetical protein